MAAEYCFRKFLSENSINDTEVSSRGTRAFPHAPTNPATTQALRISA